MGNFTKSLVLLVFLFFAFLHKVSGQEELYRQNFDESSEFPEEFINNGWEITNEDPSPASENNNAIAIFEYDPTIYTLDIIGISTLSHSNIVLRWYHRMTGAGNRTVNVYYKNEAGAGWNLSNVINSNVEWSETQVVLPGGASNLEALEIRFEIISSNNGSEGTYQIDDLVVEGIVANIFYNKSNSDLSILSNWGSDLAGEGTSPESFNAPNILFYVSNGDDNFIANDWTVNGAGSKIIITEGAKLIISNSHNYNGNEIDIQGTGTIETFNNSPIPLGSLSTNSSVKYVGGNQEVYATNYGNLEISGTGIKAIQSSTSTTVYGSLSLLSGELSLPNSSGITTSFYGDIYFVEGTLRGFINSNLNLASPSNSDILTFSSGGQTLRLLSLNKPTGTSVSLNSDLTVRSSMRLNSGTLMVNSNSLTIGGTLIGGDNLYTNEESDLNVINTTSTSELILPSSISSINNLSVTGRILTLNTDLNLFGTLTVNSTLNAKDKTITGTGSIILHGTVQTTNTNGYTGTFQISGAHSLATTSTINYDRAGDQIITPVDGDGYGNLTISGGGVKTADNSIIVIRGNFNRIGTSANFSPGTSSTINFSGSMINRNLSFTGYHNLSFTSSSSSTTTWAGNLNLTGNLIIEASNTVTPPNGGTINIAGNWENNGGTFNAGTSNVVFNGATAQLINGNTAFNHVTFSGVGLKTINGNPSIAQIIINNGAIVNAGESEISLSGNFTNNGTFDPGTSTLNFTGTNSLLPFEKEFYLNNVNITGTGSLTPTSLINISGIWANTGNFLHNNGKVVFAGGSAQSTVGSTDFYNLEINKTESSTLTLSSSNHNIYNVLKLSSGTLNTNDNLTLVSTPDLTARIDKVEDGATIEGEVTIQRILVRNKLGYYYLGTPIKNQTIASWLDDFWIQGIDVRYPNASFKNVSTYDEATRSWIPVTSGSKEIKPGMGVKVLMYVSNFATGSMTFDNKGLPIIGDGNDGSNTGGAEEFVIENLTYTNTDDNHSNSGYHLLANPFPSDIEWSETGWDLFNIDEVLYIWDGDNFSYRSLLLDGTGDDGYEKIASGQGFMLKANGNGASVKINEDAKTGGATFFRKKPSENLLKITIKDLDKKYDNSYIRLKEGATAGFDQGMDGYKLKGSNINIYTKDELNDSYVINSIGLLKKDTLINLYTTISQAGDYSLSIGGLSTFKSDVQLWLYDSYLDTTMLVNEEFNYSFAFTDSDRHKEIERFSLLFGRGNVNISGTVYNKFNEIIENARIGIYLDDKFLKEELTNNNGNYLFKVQPNKEYKLQADLSSNYEIKIEDLYSLIKILETSESISNIVDFISADLDKSNKIDKKDLQLLTEYYLGIKQPENSYSFIPYSLKNTNYTESGFIDYINAEADDDLLDLNFIGIAKGDLYSKPFLISDNSMELNVENLRVSSGNTMNIPVTINKDKNIIACNLIYNWDPTKIQFIGFASTDSNLDYIFNNQEGYLNIVYYSENKNSSEYLISFTVIGQEGDFTSITLDEKSTVLTSRYELINLVDNQEHNIIILKPNNSNFSVTPVYPNPIISDTKFGFSISDSDEVRIVILNLQGSIVDEVVGKFPQGYNLINWSRGNLKAGVYLYRVIYKEEVQSLKMILQ